MNDVERCDIVEKSNTDVGDVVVAKAKKNDTSLVCDESCDVHSPEQVLRSRSSMTSEYGIGLTIFRFPLCLWLCYGAYACCDCGVWLCLAMVAIALKILNCMSVK